MYRFLFSIFFINILITNLFGFSTSLKTTMYKKSYKNQILNELQNKNYFLISKSLIKKYYKGNNYEFFFIKNGELKQLAYDFMDIVENDEILKATITKEFNLEKLNKEIKSSEYTSSIDTLIKTDISILQVYDKYISYLSKGSIDWKKFNENLEKLNKEDDINAHWEKYIVYKNARYLLYKAIKQNDIYAAINEVDSTFKSSKLLSIKIKEYEKINEDGGFEKIPEIEGLIKVGKYYPQIVNIRTRLEQENYISPIICDEEKSAFEDTKTENDCTQFYDKKLFNAVKRFQKNHGLLIDGVIGKNTINILNTPISELIEKMRLNLERMRWMKRDLGEEYIIVNIPDYNLKMYSEDKKLLDMAVIVGDSKHPTPVFSHWMSKIILNPYWKIPQTIVKKEIIPNLIKDPNYLQEEDIRVHENWDHDSLQFDTTAVNWNYFANDELIGDPTNAPMRFIQIPGDKNPLGRIKFLFPNKYSVYLHDTPSKDLFKLKDRALSHGCIRLSEPKELLKTILEKETNEITYDNATNIIHTKQRKELNLDEKIPIHIVYLTSWVDEDGELQFRDDIYNYDKIQESLLFKSSPVLSVSKL